MPRYKLTIEYDGTNYYGWQKQPTLPSIQQSLEKALAHFTQHECNTVTAGRTDAGVHAVGQIVHVDLEQEWRLEKIQEATNGILKFNEHPIAVVAAQEVDENFDARRSATKRHYRYRVVNRRANLTVDYNRIWHVRRPIDAQAMDKAAKLLLGRHDFSTFRSKDCQAASPIRSLDQLDVRVVEGGYYGGDEIEILCSSRAFLHNQVRSLVGSLKFVGEGKWSEADLVAALKAKDRKACGTVAPACGLYLMEVDY